MNILIIGTGNMARGISTRLLAGGHEVALYDPDPSDAETLVNELRGMAVGPGSVKPMDALSEAIPASDVVILASWYSVNLETARDHSRALDGKVVIDISTR